MILIAAILAVVAGLVLGLVLYAGWMARRAARLVPPCGAYRKVRGMRLHYLDIGEGPAILMIHGLGSQLQTYTFAIVARLRGFRLILVDRPGSGYSQAGPSAALVDQADVLDALLGDLGIERAVVVGHSLGGAVALAMAITRPERVEALALIAPATQPQDTVPEALRGLALRSDPLRWIVGWTLATPLTLIGQARTLRELFAPDPVPPDFATRGGGVLALRPWIFRSAARDLAAAADGLAPLAARYDEIHVPIGILFGSGDRILDPALHGDRLAACCGIEVVRVAEGGHMLPLSAPKQTTDFIVEVARRAHAGADAA